MFPKLIETIKEVLRFENIFTVRKAILQLWVDAIQSKIPNHEAINLNFICTHNSRRSHLAQIWAQVAAAYLFYSKCKLLFRRYRRNGFISKSNRNIG